jgi:hypothetical protein
VRRNSLPRSFERTGGLYLSEQAVPLGQYAWSNGNSKLLGRVPAPSESSLSVHLGEFLSFARLRPTLWRSGACKMFLIGPTGLNLRYHVICSIYLSEKGLYQCCQVCQMGETVRECIYNCQHSSLLALQRHNDVLSQLPCCRCWGEAHCRPALTRIDGRSAGFAPSFWLNLVSRTIRIISRIGSTRSAGVRSTRRSTLGSVMRPWSRPG